MSSDVPNPESLLVHIDGISAFLVYLHQLEFPDGRIELLSRVDVFESDVATSLHYSAKQSNVKLMTRSGMAFAIYCIHL